MKFWFLETRPQFLTLSVVLAFLGNVLAWYQNESEFNIWHALLGGFGLVLAHACVNIFNDYFDYRSGVDLATKRTPFSGGSGMLPEKLLTPQQVLWLAIALSIVTTAIGIYFVVVSGILLLPLLLVAAFFILLYSPLILKHNWPEWAAGAGLGALPVLGMYFAQTGEYTWTALVASIPSFFLVHNLLLLNEFPDVEADAKASRKTLPITIGKGGAAVFFSVVAIAVHVWIIAWVAAGVLPVWTLLAVLALPFTIRSINGARHHSDVAKFMPGMAANVMAVLLIQFLMGVGLIIANVLR